MDENEKAVLDWAITEVHALRFLVKRLYVQQYRNLPDSADEASKAIEATRGTAVRAEFPEAEHDNPLSMKGAISIFLDEVIEELQRR